MCCLNTIKGKNVILCVSIRLPSIETLPIFSVTAEIFPTSTLFIMQQNLISSNRRKGLYIYIYIYINLTYVILKSTPQATD